MEKFTKTETIYRTDFTEEQLEYLVALMHTGMNNSHCAPTKEFYEDIKSVLSLSDIDLNGLVIKYRDFL